MTSSMPTAFARSSISFSMDLVPRCAWTDWRHFRGAAHRFQTHAFGGDTRRNHLNIPSSMRGFIACEVLQCAPARHEEIAAPSNSNESLETTQQQRALFGRNRQPAPL